MSNTNNTVNKNDKLKSNETLKIFDQSEENIRNVESDLGLLPSSTDEDNIITDKSSSFIISNPMNDSNSNSCTEENDLKENVSENSSEQLCRDIQQKLQIQNEFEPNLVNNSDNALSKSPVSRPRSVFTYASEQSKDFGNTLRTSNSTPNATKINEYIPLYERNNSGNELHVFNQSSSDYDFTARYFSPRNAQDFEPHNFHFGQTAPFRISKDIDYINGKNNKETQISQSTNNLPSWRLSSRLNASSKIPLQLNSSNTVIPTIPSPISAMNYYNTDEMQHYTAIDNWREHDLMEPGAGGAMATPHGTITLRLHDRVRVDMTLDKAVRVVNFKNNIVVSVSATGSASGLLHPNGRVYQYGSRVEILAHDQHTHNNKYAKMWYKGVSFTSDQCALVYLVDSAGTRTTTDTFSDLSQDFSLSIFYNESRHGPQYVQEAINILQASQYWITEDGTENWIINNVRISQTSDGLVRIGRNSNKFSLRTSPANGSASVSSPYVHCTGSLGQTSHLFVRRGERRMHYDGASFIVRNAGHSAGFDDKHQLKVY